MAEESKERAQREAAGGNPRVARTAPPPMLDSLLNDILDPGYAKAAARKAAPQTHAARSPRWPAIVWIVVGALLVGLLLGVAGRNTRDNAPGIQQARDALNLDVAQAQADESGLAASASSLATEVRSRQAAVGGGSGQRTLDILEAMNALTPVAGPGLRVSVTDPDAAAGEGAVFDRDIQVLVNSLWASGAEAIAISGVRLRLTSAIRQAGGAILVDNRPVVWPLVIEAIGNPASIHQKFISTTGYGRFQGFGQLYGVGFDVLAVDSLTLPAAAAIDNRYVEPPPAQTAPVSAASTQTSPTR
ncbi:DUF881 domain-containing protein [Nakamurella antarctica]|uniref:DUF881 domain-containing protein n=1 Tax=Nakamurella antarctica TaxID=1902245 RepID=A0A3G8ZKA6_9ACTN|nr:DUF881 domain-containing protein [Nakamurella antarctica]AZI57628.1 DUF881 domain-containing protein [Nakamurella antarctica]